VTAAHAQTGRACSTISWLFLVRGTGVSNLPIVSLHRAHHSQATAVTKMGESNQVPGLIMLHALVRSDWRCLSQSPRRRISCMVGSTAIPGYAIPKTQLSFHLGSVTCPERPLQRADCCNCQCSWSLQWLQVKGNHSHSQKIQLSASVCFPDSVP